ncbi:hypothetical protein PPACK8108_LOCUS16 [Phakopsora pachyrhizi]|uniref:Uncharacterized protein n=1 Tax=Phakopsora pachyrhizi TaxID=170000 RepID=A0AAV0ACM5_PHAPC|nr:hypothetical protein PPACK8108_LOCUS16 [Phakopsora pachyrhizi]
MRERRSRECSRGVLREVWDEGVAVKGNEWHHCKEGQKLGGGAHQGQSGWSKTTGAKDL